MKEQLTVQKAPAPVLSRKCSCGSGKKDEECDCLKKPASLQRAAAGHAAAPAAIPPIVHEVLSSPGRPIDSGPRGMMEQHFGRDFGGVRIHTGDRAAKSAQSVDALAYTVGSDIVFDSGHYQPHTEEGRALLAHELTHTIQQEGLQRYSNRLEMGGTTANDPLEREAEAATASWRSSNFAGVSPRASQRVLSRTPRGRRWTPLPAPVPVGNTQEVTDIDRDPTDPTLVAVKINKFRMPGSKGPVGAFYRQAATQVGGVGALEATVDLSGTPRAGLRQARASTPDLIIRWLEKAGWTEANAAFNWCQRGGKKPPTDGFPARSPEAGTNRCDIDHILELQLGGTNVPLNLQCLDSEENSASGRDIWQQVRSIATALPSSLPGGVSRYITMNFASIEVEGTEYQCPAAGVAPGSATDCKTVECAILNNRPLVAATGPSPIDCGTAPAAGAAPAAATEAYRLRTPTAEAVFQVNSSGTTPLRHHLSAELIPGMVLEELDRNATPNAITAFLDAGTHAKRSRTRTPADLQATDSPLVLRVSAPAGADQSRTLTLDTGRTPGISFRYPFLSQGTLRPSYNPQRGLEATGTITPTIPLLRQLNVHYADGQLTLTRNLNAAQLSSIIPGVRITRADISLQLSPSLAANGTLAFALGSFVTGSATVTGTPENGLTAEGVIQAHIPGVNRADGTVRYNNGQWTGEVVIGVDKIPIPGVQSATLRVDLDNQGITPSGEVRLLIAGQSATLSVTRQHGNWVLSGSTSLNVPGLRPIDLSFRHDGRALTGTAHTSVQFHGLTGDFVVNYRDGHITGRGTVAVNRGRARGQLTVNLSESGHLSGEGTVTVQLTPNLIGTVGIVLAESGTVTVRGALEFPQPIRIFGAIGGHNDLFRQRFDIPIVGISLGVTSVGLIARIEFALSSDYGIGPGEFRNVRIETQFNPLEDNPNLELRGGGQLVIPAHAGLNLAVSGSIGVSAAVASITGGLTVTGTVGLAGGLTATASFTYRQGLFSFESTTEISASPVFRLGLDAFVEGELGAWGISISKRWTWNLASFQYGSGLRFGMIVPVNYTSGQPFHMPPFDQIQWIRPNLDASDVLGRLLDRARGSE